MSAITSLDLLNTRIDLGNALSYRKAQAPGFIKLFQTPTTTEVDENGIPIPRVATARKHNWLEGVSTPKTKSFTAYTYVAASDGPPAVEESYYFTVADTNGWQAGDLFHIQGRAELFRVSSVATGKIYPTLVAQNGSSFAFSSFTAASGGVLVFDSRPVPENSTSGESLYRQSGSSFNYVQIFRGDVEMSDTSEAVDQAGNENDMTYQVEAAIDEMLRRINAALVFGAPVERTATVPGSMGGLYYFGTQSGGLSIARNDSPALSANLLNRAAQLITDQGCVPDAILCGSGQAEVISALAASQVHWAPNDRTRGTYADQFVAAAGGVSMRVFIEPSIPDTDCWVLDTRGLALLPLKGRALRSSPATNPTADGKAAKLIGEYTAEFKNAKQAFCRISGLKASSLTLA